MMKCYLDSNCLIYYKNSTSPHYEKIMSIISQLAEDSIPLFISPLVIDEFLHNWSKELVIHGKISKKNLYKELYKSLDLILNIPLLSIVNPPVDLNKHLLIVELMDKYQLRARDAFHLLIMQENQIDGFVTFDKDFEKVFAAKTLQAVV